MANNPIPRQEYIRSGTVRSLNVEEELSYQGVPFVPSAATDEKAKVSSNDTTAGYLEGKLVAGSNVTLTTNNEGGNETITIAAAADNDEKSKVSSNDTTAGYLNGKLVAGAGVTLTENSDGGNETLTIASTIVNTDQTAKVSSNDTTAGFLNGKLVAGTNITLTENNDGGNESLTIDASGGVVGFTASLNTSAPNNTVNASLLLVDAATTNADAVLQPKGTGALQAQLADDLVSGGNKRGLNAVDLQTFRTGAHQVASGYQSFTAGVQNRASGNQSVAIGTNNTQISQSGTSIGYQNYNSAYQGTVIGNGNTSFGSYSVVIGSYNTQGATATFMFAMGRGAKTTQHHQYAYSAGDYSQYEKYVLNAQTFSDFASNMTSGRLVYDAFSHVKIENNCIYSFVAYINAANITTSGQYASFKVEGTIRNLGGTNAFVGTPTKTVLHRDVVTWDVNVIAGVYGSNRTLDFQCTGSSGQTVRWGAVVELVRTQF